MDPATLITLATTILGTLQKAKSSSDAASQSASLTGSQTDPYGNKFIPGYGWQMTPGSQEVLSAEQGEMLKNLTEDAKRNRDFRARMEDRSIQAGGDYDTTRSEFLYGPQPNEDQIIDELTQLMGIQYAKGEDKTRSTLARQALRMNQGGMIDKIMQSTGRNAAEGLVEDMLKGRSLGRQEYQNAKGFRDNDFLSRLGFFGNLERGQPQANVAKSGLYGSMVGQGQNALSSALSSSKSQSSGVDLTSIGSLIAKLAAGGGGNAQAPTTGWEPWITYPDEEFDRVVGNSPLK